MNKYYQVLLSAFVSALIVAGIYSDSHKSDPCAGPMIVNLSGECSNA